MTEGEMPGERDRRGFEDALTGAMGVLGLRVDERQAALMWDHFLRVVEANRRFNLTRITDPVEAAIKHYADSCALLAAPWVDPAGKLCVLDVGTGAGFPAIPLAILCPRWRITAIDGTRKKTRFVEEAANALELEHVRVRHARASELVRDRSARFDLILLRAVSKMAAGLEEVGGLPARGGSIVFYKSSDVSAEEWAQGRAAAKRFGLKEAEGFQVTLPAAEGVIRRQLVRFRRSTPRSPSGPRP